MLKVLNRWLLLLFVINIAFGLTSQLIQPLFPLYLRDIGATEIQNALVISLGNLSSTLLMLPGGMLIAKMGKRNLLLLSMALSGSSVLLMAFTRDWTLVVPLNILFNVSMCFFMPTRMAIIAENTTPTNRASLFGVMNLAWPISGIIGPIASGFLVETLGWGSVFVIASTISLVSILPTFRAEEKKEEKEQEAVKRVKGPSILDRRYLPMMAVLFALQVFVTTSLAGINMILPIFLEDKFKLSYSLIGMFFTGSNVLLLFTQILGGYMADRFGRRRLLLICLALTPIAMGAMVLVDNWMVLFGLYALAFGLQSMTWPATLAFLTDLVPGELRGTAFGLNMAGSRLGFTIGPLVAAFFYSAPASSNPFLLATAVFILGLPMAYLLKERTLPESS